MKIILSRKGFDAENGKTANPVMPDGAMLSLPIPQPWDGDFYDELFYGSMSYMDIWQSLKPKQEYLEASCHLDPDLRPNIRLEIPEGWRPLFGQCDAAETHLENQGVVVGDLFLFFGWFRETEMKDGNLRYKRSSKDAHMLYGYLQIGDIVRGEDIAKFPWHPHSFYDNDNNTIYVASEHLIVDGEDTGLPGAGTFKYSEELILTMPGQTKSRWKLPDFFKEVNISCHSKDSFKPEGYFQSVRIGQEFVVSEDDRVTQWAKNIIVNNYDSRIVPAEGEKKVRSAPALSLSANSFELCNGATVSLNEEQTNYVCSFTWLGNSIDVLLASDDYAEDNINGLKCTFEAFWKERDSWLERGKNSIKEKLLPFLLKRTSSAEFSVYPAVSAIVFDTKYHLTGITVLWTEYEAEVKLSFNNEDDSEHFDELSITLVPGSDYISFEAGLMPIQMDDIET